MDHQGGNRGGGKKCSYLKIYLKVNSNDDYNVAHERKKGFFCLLLLQQIEI